MPVVSTTPDLSHPGRSRYGRTTGARRTGIPVRHAITLLELLVVLVVISLLTGMALPVLLHTRDLAHQGVCLSNMRQTTLAMNLYREDYDEYFPSLYADARSASRAEDLNYWHDTFCRGTFLAPEQASWATLVRPYAGRVPSAQAPVSAETASVFFCPRDRDRSHRALTSFEFKMWLAMNRPLSNVEYPANTIQLWEQWAYHAREMWNEHDRRARMNVAFVDGHIRPLLMSQTTSAQFGSGPDLHFPFRGFGPDNRFSNQDIAQ